MRQNLPHSRGCVINLKNSRGGKSGLLLYKSDKIAFLQVAYQNDPLDLRIILSPTCLNVTVVRRGSKIDLFFINTTATACHSNTAFNNTKLSHILL